MQIQEGSDHLTIQHCSSLLTLNKGSSHLPVGSYRKNFTRNCAGRFDDLRHSQPWPSLLQQDEADWQ